MDEPITDKTQSGGDKMESPTDKNQAAIARPKRRSPGMTNAQADAELARAERVVAAAQRPTYNRLLAGRGITAAFVATLAADTAQCRSAATEAVTHTTKKTQASAEELAAKKALLGQLRTLQSTARQTFADTNPEHHGPW